MTRIHYLLHVPFETPGIITLLAEKYQCETSATHLWEKAEFPHQNDFDFLIIMGGPMNIYEENRYPWLADEKRFIASCIDTGKKILGICLGSQLLADALGASVVRNRCKEIGWYPIVITKSARETPLLRLIPAALTPFHWHGDTYPPPPGALPLGSSDACDCQGFIFDNRIVALQFHLEMTAESLDEIIKACSNELVSDEYVQTAREIKYYAEKMFPPAQQAMEQLFRSLIAA